MTDLKPFTDQLYSVWGDSDVAAALKILSKLDSNNVPEAQIGVTNGQRGTKPWLGYVGNLDVSYKSDPARHIELALEHLVAAQTVPTLKAAWDSQVEVKAEAARKQFTDRLHSESMLNVLSRYNEAWLNSNPCASWREMQARTGMDDAELLDFIEHQRVEQVKAQRAFLESPEAMAALKQYNSEHWMYSQDGPTWEHAAALGVFDARTMCEKYMKAQKEAAENAARTAQEDERYRDKRRVDWLQEFTGATAVSWKNTTPLSQKAIDRLIDGEIKDGATK